MAKRIDRVGIYIASRTRHAPKWREARDNGVHITSSWIDQPMGGEGVLMGSLWRTNIAECTSCAALVLYREDDEPLKGALIEAGAALGAGRPVFAVVFTGRDDMKAFSFLHHPMAIRCENLQCALNLAGALER